MYMSVKDFGTLAVHSSGNCPYCPLGLSTIMVIVAYIPSVLCLKSVLGEAVIHTVIWVRPTRFIGYMLVELTRFV